MLAKIQRTQVDTNHHCTGRSKRLVPFEKAQGAYADYAAQLDELRRRLSTMLQQLTNQFSLLRKTLETNTRH